MRAILSFGLLLALVGFAFSYARGDEGEKKAEKTAPERLAPGKGVSIDVLIADVGPSAGDDASDPAADKILQLEKQGKLAALTRVRLTTLENVSGMVQFGERVGVATGRTFTAGPRGGGGADGPGGPGGARAEPFGATSYTYQNMGTLVTATPRVEDDGSIVLELMVEQSRLADQPPMPEGERPSFSPGRTVVITSKTTLRVPPGKSVVTGGKRSAGKDAGQTWIVVSAKEMERK